MSADKGINNPAGTCMSGTALTAMLETMATSQRLLQEELRLVKTSEHVAKHNIMLLDLQRKEGEQCLNRR